MTIIENLRNQILEKSGYNERMRQMQAERDLMWIVFSQIKEAEKEIDITSKKSNLTKKARKDK